MSGGAARSRTGEKAGSKLDDVGRSFKKGLVDARDALRAVRRLAGLSITWMSRRGSTAVCTGTRLSPPARWISTSRAASRPFGARPDAKAKAKAVELAEDTVGISKVIDQLTIQPPPRTTPDTSSDATPKS